MIKVTIGGEPQKKEIGFPKLMIANNTGGADKGMIVLFEIPKHGQVIRPVIDSNKGFGYISTDFIMSCFEDFNEPITLQNITE